MNKIYKLLVDSLEYPKGISVKWNEDKKYYAVYKPNGEINVNENGNIYFIEDWQIENRPSVWELQEEKLDLRSPEAERMREEARSKRWEFIPNTADRYYFSGIKKNGIDWLCWNESGDVIDRSIWSTGNCHRTEEEALAWGEKYARYFLTE